MKVFISWSGPRSLAIAVALKKWIKSVIQNLEPWISSEDIRSGSRWMEEIAKQLADTNIGIICLTPDNLKSEWIHFEAGAIAKLPKSSTCTVLFKLEHNDVDRPLSEFNHTKIESKESMLKLMKDLNRESGDKLSEADLESAFNMWWPKLEATLVEVEKIAAPTVQKRDNNSKIDEILETVRGLANSSSTTDHDGSLDWGTGLLTFPPSIEAQMRLISDILQKMENASDSKLVELTMAFDIEYKRLDEALSKSYFSDPFRKAVMERMMPSPQLSERLKIWMANRRKGK